MATESFSKKFKVSKNGADDFTKKMVARSIPLRDESYHTRSVAKLSTKEKIMATLRR